MFQVPQHPAPSPGRGRLLRRTGTGSGPRPRSAGAGRAGTVGVRLQLAVTVPLIAIAAIAAAPITRVLVAFPEPEKMASAVGLFRVMVPYAALAGAAAVLMGALHARNVFVVPALAPLLFSVGVITSVLFLAPRWGILAAAAGVLAGGVLQLLFQVPAFCTAASASCRACGSTIGCAGSCAAGAGGRLGSGVRGHATGLVPAGQRPRRRQHQRDLLRGGLLPVAAGGAVGVRGNRSIPRLAEMAADNRTTELRRSATDGMVTLAALLVPAAIAYLLLGTPSSMPPCSADVSTPKPPS